jgi:hypothetical protein
VSSNVAQVCSFTAVPEILVAYNFYYYYSKFHMSESRRFHQPYMVSAHFLHLSKVKFMEEGTPPPAYTFSSYTTYTPPHNPVITGTLSVCSFKSLPIVFVLTQIKFHQWLTESSGFTQVEF